MHPKMTAPDVSNVQFTLEELSEVGDAVSFALDQATGAEGYGHLHEALRKLRSAQGEPPGDPRYAEFDELTLKAMRAGSVALMNHAQSVYGDILVSCHSKGDHAEMAFQAGLLLGLADRVTEHRERVDGDA